MSSTGVVLMLVLFSFGLLFSNWVTPTPAFPVASIVEPAVPSTRIFHHDEFEYASNSRHPLVVLKEQDIPTQRLELSHGIIVDRQAIADKPNSEEELKLSFTPFSLESDSMSLPTFTTTEDDILSTALVQPSLSDFTLSEESSQSCPTLKTESIDITIPTPPQSDPTTNSSLLRPQISVWRSNTTYLLCGNVAQIQPGPDHKIEDYPDERQQIAMITIFIPPDESNPQKTFLSVTCQVLETEYIPAEMNSRSTSLFSFQSSSLAYM
jgi:hypothetical protein